MRSYLVYKIVVRDKTTNRAVQTMETSASSEEDAIQRMKSMYDLYTDEAYTFKATLLDDKL